MCTNPISLRVNKPFTYSIQVPCGKCFECLKKYQNDWMIRIYEEIQNASKSGRTSTFFTLTYDPDSVPLAINMDTGEVSLSVYKVDVQNNLKRFRTRRARAGYRTDFKYFITSEYGPTTLRPHYHGIFFGLSPKECRSFFRDWQLHYGFTSTSEITVLDSPLKAAEYVSKYCSKGFFENPKVSSGDVLPTFHLISKRLGLSYVERMKDFHLFRKDFPFEKRISFAVRRDYSLEFEKDSHYYGFKEDYLQVVLDNRFVYVNGFRYSMPKYYKSKIYGEQTNLSYALSNLAFKNHCDLRDARIRELQSEGSRSYLEALHALLDEEASVLEQRRKTAKQTLGKFYDRNCAHPVVGYSESQIQSIYGRI